MSSSTSAAPSVQPRRAAGRRRAALRSWQSAIGLAGVAGGAIIITGCLLPWASVYAGLINYAGTSGSNGRILAVAGGVIVLAGLCHLIRGQSWSRWLTGLAGFASLGFAGLLLLHLAGSLQSLGSDSMVVLRAGPGLWVVAGGAVIAFVTLFLPSSQQQALRARTDTGGMRAWAADLQSCGLRRKLQLGLGLLWVLDAALQFQPFMFGRGFATSVIDPAAMGSPAFIAGSVTGAGQLMLTHPALYNTAFAAIQLALGLGLLWRRSARAALAGTIIWALAVWWFGEAAGGMFSGMASPLTGAPGAALLYALLGILLWPAASRTPARGAASLADRGTLGRYGARAVWIALWGGFAALMFQPRVQAAGAFRAAIGGMTDGEPGWLAGVDRAVAGWFGASGLVPALILGMLFTVIAAAILVPKAVRPVLILAGLLALAIWFVGENFGGLTTGSATDPETGPLLLLLIAAFWPRRSADDKVRRVELTGATAEVEGEARPQREVAALVVEVPAGAARAPDGLRQPALKFGVIGSRHVGTHLEQSAAGLGFGDAVQDESQLALDHEEHRGVAEAGVRAGELEVVREAGNDRAEVGRAESLSQGSAA
jgi:hypothetical protein